MRYEPRRASVTISGIEVKEGETMRLRDHPDFGRTEKGYTDFTIGKVTPHDDGITITIEALEQVADE